MSSKLPHFGDGTQSARILGPKDYIPVSKPDEVTDRIVPCGTCQACCKNDAIFIHPECGDVVEDYKTVEYKGRLMLDHKPNGNCWYLDDKRGCTIHHRAPAVCREFDCRVVMLNPPDIYKKLMSPATIRAAKKQLKLLNRQINNRKRLAKLKAKQEKK